MLTLFSWQQDRNALIQSLSTNPEYLKNKVKFLPTCSSFILVQCFGGRFKMQTTSHAGVVMAKGGIFIDNKKNDLLFFFLLYISLLSSGNVADILGLSSKHGCGLQRLANSSWTSI